MLRSGGKVLVDQLALHGAELAFCVPGESYLAVLDALHDAPIRLVTCRHEAAAANMAEAYGKLTGRPGICLVTRGPGATHASIGVHTAYQDSTPLILLIGQVGRDMLEREAFQEIDYRRMFNSMAKWVAQIESAERIPELLARAFSVATAGRPGPVVLALPEDMLVDEVDVADPGPYRQVHTHPGRRSSSGCATSSRRPSGRSRSSAAASGAPRRPRTSLRSARRTSCRSRPRFAARTTSTTAPASSPATSASGSTRRSRGG